MKNLIYSLTLIFSTSILFSQKIDTDSLLVITQKNYQNNKIKNAKELSKLALQIDPKYDDFNLILGQIYLQEKQLDSSKICFETVIRNNPKYKEAYIGLANMYLKKHELSPANQLIDNALLYFTDDTDLLNFKKNIQNQENTPIFQKSNLLGSQYTLIIFDRDNIGPWHLLNIHYKHQRTKLTSIIDVNYFSRNNSVGINPEGIQYELSQYLKHSQKNYSYWNLAYSNDILFPKFKAGYSFFQNLKSYEFEIGARYTNIINQDIFGSTLGVGKYYKNFWFNLKNNLIFYNSNVYDSYRFTSRYYYNTKYDYITFLLATGSSPDDRVIQGSLNQRVGLQSYNSSLGYSKLWSDKFITSIQINYNNQEYFSKFYQNEWGINLNLEYNF